MRIPDNAVIPRDKLTRYLLVPKPRNDKSAFLAQAGFTVDNPDVLEAAIRRHASENESVADRADEYGQFYKVEGPLHGPDGILSTVTIWLTCAIDGETRFVTLKPARSRS